MILDERVTRYLDKIPGAISGSDGHGQTFTVACALVNGFALGTDDALRYLRDHYNPRCSPPWKDRELRHKVLEAEKTPHSKPRGHLLATDPARRPEAGQGCAKPVPVLLTPKKRKFGTLGTFLFHPTDNVRAYTHSILGNEKQPSPPSQVPATVGTSTGLPVDLQADTSIAIPIDHSLDWTAINAEFPPSPEDEAWRAVEAAGFGGEPLIALAFSLFGPGCRIISTGEAASV